jgi:putative transposase
MRKGRTSKAPEPRPETDLDEVRRAGDLKLKDARLAILKEAEIFRTASRSAVEADKAFCLAYNTRKLALDSWVCDTVRRISAPTLRRWRTAVKDGEPMRLTATSKRNRKGTACLDVAEDGAVAAFIKALIEHNAYATAEHIRVTVAREFGEVLSITRANGRIDKIDLPSMRSFQVFIKTCKAENRQFFLAKTDPDRFKSTMRIAGKSRDRVTRLNELWEIDASPSDVMTTDGRYSLYAVIDIYSRRMMVLITKTPRAEAMLLLIRRAILAWGVPERIRTDNGSDFIAERSRRAFASLGIEHDLCAPFSPEQKGVVERAIGTIQKSLMRVSPGFIGHNVAQRKQIEGRRAFARRLGEKVDKLLCVQSTAAQLQSDCDDWCKRNYYHRKHSTLGVSPLRAVAEYKGSIRQIEDERALDLLLADVADGGGLRVMGRQGVRVGGDLYITSGLAVGERVLVRHDPTDMGRIYCFTPDGETFLAEAICPETAGVDRAAAVSEARRAQQRQIAEETAAIKSKARRIKPRDMIDALLKAGEEQAAKLAEFPKQKQAHVTPQIEAASQARRKAPPPSAPISEATRIRAEETAAEWNAQRARQKAAPQKPISAADLKELEKDERAVRQFDVEGRIVRGEPVTDWERKWLEGYRNSSEYRSNKGMYEMFAESWLGPIRDGVKLWQEQKRVSGVVTDVVASERVAQAGAEGPRHGGN